MEDNLQLRVNFEARYEAEIMVGGRQPLVKDDLRLKTTFGGR